MALVPEDGTGLADANTFATRAELIAYALSRGVTVPDNEKADVNLVLAMDVLLTKNYIGAPTHPETQALPFPRVANNPLTNQPAFPDDVVPPGMKRAQLMLALASHQGVRLMSQESAGRRLKSRDVGPMKRTYADDAGSEFATVAGLDAVLRPFLVAEGGFTLLTKRA